MQNEPNRVIKEELIKIFNSKEYLEVIKRAKYLEKKFPKSIFVFNLLGVTYSEVGNFKLAIDNFEKIVKINSNNSEIYFNLGFLYKKIQLIDKSIDCYNECIRINPKKFEAYNNLANIYKSKNKIEIAVKNYLKCLEINSNYLIALQNFGICLQEYNFPEKKNIYDKNIINLLIQNKVLRPVDIIKCLINYLYLDKEFVAIINSNKKLEKNFLDDLIFKITNNKILIELLKIVPISDITIEKFLRFLRAKILLNISIIKNKEYALKIIEAIATQCFINEYIYPFTQKEETQLREIEKIIIHNLKVNKINECALEISCLASYRPLNSYKWSSKIKDFDEIKNLFRQQIREPNEELLLRKKLESKKIINEVSLKVKHQYENNPYPRWEKIALLSNSQNPEKFFRSIRINCKYDQMKNWNNINVLVAGCGTGQHAITTATKYKNSFVTAIDLSISSLGYAKRKANELNIKNLDFLQMDILDLKKFKQKFHIIECVGVLHHMKDPFKGWKILCDLLNEHGLMMIGLYSKHAREHISETRKEIQSLYSKINIDNIKNYRDRVIQSKDNKKKLLMESSDFYSVSSLRDLLFHVQEHQFTIPEIENYLNKLNMSFCGFENNLILKLFREINNNKNDLVNLKLWNEFELKNQRVFAGMYQFWCQKI